MAAPWDRQPEETARRFEAFTIYMRMSPGERTIQRVTDHLGLKNVRNHAGWSSRHHWVERALAYDEHLASLRRAAAEQDLINASRNQAKIASLNQGLIAHKLQALGKTTSRGADELRVQDIAQLFKASVAIEREALGYLAGQQDASTNGHGRPSDDRQELDPVMEFRQTYVEPVNVFVPHDLQRAAIACMVRYMAIVAGVGGGKTRTGAINFWQRVLQDDNPNAFYLLVAPDTINGQVMCEHFVAVAPRGWILNPAGTGPHYARTWNLQNGARVQFRSADKPERIVARRAHGIWVDEFTLLRAGAWRVSLRGRLSGTGKGSLGWAIFTGTPRGKNWAYDDIWRRTLEDDDDHDESYQGYTWPSHLNPAVDQVDVEEARRNLPGPYFDREWGASWEAFRGQIYTDWSEDRFVAKGLAQQPLVPGTVAYMAVDWGFSKPGAALTCRRLPNGAWHAIEELHEAGKLAPWWAGKIAHAWGRHKVDTIWCDPEEPERIAGLVEEGMPARMANNRGKQGIRHLAGLIRQGLFFVDAGCTILRRHLAEYHWLEDRHGSSTEEPEKVNDHLPDCARYVTYSTETDQGLGEQVTRGGHAVVPLDDQRGTR